MDLTVYREEPLADETKAIDMAVQRNGGTGGAGEVFARGACSEGSDMHRDIGL